MIVCIKIIGFLHTGLPYNGSDDSISGVIGQGQTSKNGMWINTFSQWADQDEEENYEGFSYDMHGFSTGFDRLIGSNFLAGLSFSMMNTDIEIDDSRNNGDIESLYGGLYSSYFTDRFYIDGAITYANHDYDNTRYLEIGSLSRDFSSSHDGDSISAYVEGGYNFDFVRWIVQPFSALSYIYLSEDEFTETGGADVNLNVEGRQTNSLLLDLGARLSKVFDTSLGSVIPELSASWNYDFGIDDNTTNASFVGFPSVPLSIEGRENQEQGLKLEAKLNLISKGGFTTSISYGEFLRDGYRTSNVMGGVRFEF